jgi:lipopolysaccharide export system protein LptA
MPNIHANRIAAFLLTSAILTLSAGLAPGQTQKRQPSAPAKPITQNETKRFTIGEDIVVTGYTSGGGKLDLSSTHLRGPNTRIEITEKKTRSKVLLHGDDIDASNISKPQAFTAEMRGNVRYTLTQQTREGERIIKGTAGKAVFHRTNQKIDLTGGVSVDLTDPRLIGPGILKAGKIVIDISKSPYHYTVEGDDSVNDLKFTPRRVAKKEDKPGSDSSFGPVHIHHYDTGEFQVGKLARFEGAGTTADLEALPKKTQAQLKAPHMEAIFDDSGAQLLRTEATGGVHYDIARMVAKHEGEGETRQQIVGTGGKAIYDVEKGRVDLLEEVEATLIDPETLLGPAKLSAAGVVVYSGPIHYEFTGSNGHSRIQLTPRPPKAKPAAVKAEVQKAEAAKPEARKPDAAQADKPAVIPFMMGTITLTGFQTGRYDPGKQIVFHGPSLLMETKDAATKSESSLHAHHFVADFAADGAIAKAEATQEVRYFLQHPAPGGMTLQSLKGTATLAAFIREEKSGSIKLKGPLETEYSDPANLEGPAHITGQKGDTLTLNLTNREFDFDSPDGTFILTAIPKETAPKTEQKPDDKPKKKD